MSTSMSTIWARRRAVRLDSLHFTQHFSSHIQFPSHTTRAIADVLDLSKYFGKDSTAGGIQFQFRTLKHNAKRQKACADAGGDPQTLGIGSLGGVDQSTLFYLLLFQHQPNQPSWLGYRIDYEHN